MYVYKLSNYIWELKENDVCYTFIWVIALEADLYIICAWCGSRKCDLSLCEKLFVCRANSGSLSNKCDELLHSVAI